MEKLQSFLNFKGSDGKVITFFDGKLTLSQLFMIILALVVVAIVFKLLKGVIRTIALVVTVCVCLVHYGIASPTQIKDVATQITSKGIDTYKSVADSSKNIKIKDNSLLVQLEGDWVDVTTIKSVVAGSDNNLTIVAGGKTYTTDDDSIRKLVETFKG